MKTWFNCKVKYLKEEENGMMKNVTDAFLVDAVNYTEAEARIYEEISQMVNTEFQVSSISKSRIVEMFPFEGTDIWHKAKVVYYVTEGDNGKEKKITNQMMVNAKDLKDAYDKINDGLRGMMVTYRITEIQETNIVEVFPYMGEEDESEIPANLKPLSEVSPE